jgi:hypothetical protein
MTKPFIKPNSWLSHEPNKDIKLKKHKHWSLNSINFLKEDTWRLELVVVVVPLRSEGRAVRHESHDRGRLGDWVIG